MYWISIHFIEINNAPTSYSEKNGAGGWEKEEENQS